MNKSTRKTVIFKKIVVVLGCLFFLIFVSLKIKRESITYMGISFITEEELQERAVNPVELGNIVCLDNYLVPYDQLNNKILLPCQATENNENSKLEGKLASALPEYELYFLETGMFTILPDAMKYGYNFTLYAIDKDGNYMEYLVNFTTLPIIEMSGSVDHIDERDRDIFIGEITVWEPQSKVTNHLKAQKSRLEWHIRGFSSQSFLKKSLKLNLKDRKGNKNKLSICGFESDDDYILNPMWFDDVKVREKLAIDLWNEMADEKESNLKMSKGEYCELFINEEYQGLRLLQNKIEGSYLKLDKEDILLKGDNVNAGTSRPPESVYEVVYSNQDSITNFHAITGFFYQTDFSNVNLDSWVDLQLMLLLGNMRDNQFYKNMYYVIQRDGEEESISFVPWDTDMSFGVYWDDGFRLMPESVEYISYRMEYENLLKQYPEVQGMLAQRWRELRKNVFSEENIMNKIDSYRACIEGAGAAQRDYNVLGWYSWGEEDTLENLQSYIERRLAVIDKLYEDKE